MPHRVELYKTDEDNFRWRRVDEDGTIVTESEYHYLNHSDVLKNAMEKNPGLTIIGDVEE